MPTIHNLNSLKERRRELRSQSTNAEQILWEAVRNSRLGFKFKRQHSVGGYIADFYCAKKHLIVEIDGAAHDSSEQKEYDNIRDEFFKDFDYIVLRFKNWEVERSVEEVTQKIRNILG